LANFATHETHILKPLLDRYEQNRNSKLLLLSIAYHLVKFAPHPFDCYHWYSKTEREAAVALLKANGLGGFCNLSPRCKKQTLKAIMQAVKALKEA
jgi:hypothetical protein